MMAIFAALIILTSSSLSHIDFAAPEGNVQEQHYASDRQQDIDGLNDSDTPDGPIFVDATDDAIAAVSLLNIDHSLYFIFETAFSELDPNDYREEIFHEFTAYFRVLFRRIISPNAP